MSHSSGHLASVCVFAIVSTRCKYFTKFQFTSSTLLISNQLHLFPIVQFFFSLQYLPSNLRLFVQTHFHKSSRSSLKYHVSMTIHLCHRTTTTIGAICRANTKHQQKIPTKQQTRCIRRVLRIICIKSIAMGLNTHCLNY